MTDEVTGITPPAPGGLAAYALGSIAGKGRDAGQRSPGGRPVGGQAAGLKAAGLKVAGLKVAGLKAAGR